MAARLDARALRDVMSRYLEALQLHREEIDSLNVFPVPDGDTGTNMLLTQQAVDRALSELEGHDLPALGEAISRGALMGARGNSGVILSQALRGLCERLCGDSRGDAEALAEALAMAADQARRAVAEPVEGTMLSVLRDAAEAAEAACRDGSGPDDVAEAALAAGKESLERTTDQLPALASAGVVDAGARGLVLLLDAFVSALRGVPPSVEVGVMGPVGGGGADEGSPETTRFGFEVMYLLESDDGAILTLRERLSAIGDSLVVIGGAGMYNVHVHTDRPDDATRAGATAGRTGNVRVTSLDAQVRATCVAGEARAVRAGAPLPSRESALVAVAPGMGIARLFRSLGAEAIPGGPGDNPSVADLLASIAEAPSAAVLLLPNHRNVLPAAERAAAESGKRVHVVNTRSVSEGLAAATCFSSEASMEQNAARAETAITGVASGEVAVAVRDAETPEGPVTAGDYLGIVAGEIRAVGEDPVRVVLEVARLIHRRGHEVLTLLSGEDISGAEAERAAEALTGAFPSLEIEAHRGGQPHYPFLIGLE